MRGVEKKTEQKIPKWESDFWSYINRDSVDYCPLYNSCKARRRASWCPDECSRNFIQLNQVGCDSLIDCGKSKNFVCGLMLSSIEKLAQKYLTMGRVFCPPVSSDVISLSDKDHHIEIRYLLLKNTHGALWYWNNEWIVQLNTNDSYEDRKFTLFHEAFHILTFCHTDSESFKTNIGRENYNELMAYQFAMCILMPRKWIIRTWLATGCPIKIAKIFEVPEYLAAIRLSYLQLL